ncbi:MAG: gliding motility-associated C-terminal domain-containing protein [Chitinophagaceae bacterium]|nr:gliding motility-associated C-terminal domain-containing protein [Chitinophagaceae bacterium]
MKAQNFCLDSSIHERYSTLSPNSDSIMFHKQIKTADGGALLIGHFKKTNSNGYGIVVRFNKDGSLRWAKRIVSNPFSGYIAFETIAEANNGNIHIIARFNNGIYDSRPPFFLLVLSQNGILINQKRIGFTNSPNLNNKFVRTSLILNYGTDSLLYIFSGQINAFTENQLFLITADNSGVIGSSTIINMQPSGGWDAPVFRNGRFSGNKLILYGSSGFIGQCVNGSSNGFAFFTIEINITNKTVLLNKAYCAPMNSLFTGTYNTPRDFFSTVAYDNTFFLANGNIIMTRAYQGIDSSSSGIINRLFSISTFDSSFNHLNSEYVVTGNIMRDKTIQELVIDSLGIKHFSFYDFKNKLIYYALCDTKNDFFLQKKIELPSSKPYTDFSRINITDNEHIVNFTIITYDNSSTYIDKFKILVNDTSQACFGVDTAFLSIIPAQVSPINWQGQFIVEQGILVEQSTNFFTVDYPLQRTIICNIVNKCDTIKLNAPDTVCNISQPVIITAHKNPLCKGKVNFIFDTTAIQSFTQINDTTLSLYFNKSYKGKIYAQPNSCNKLIDSVTINVFEPANVINLGKDTTYCSGKTYTLNAYNPNFKKYIWQDGSTDSVFIAVNYGTYFVTATDYCDRVYSDTLRIINKYYPFNIGKDTMICKSESILLSVPPGYSNYNWQPKYNVIPIAPNKIYVNPKVNTFYHVSAEIFPGCELSDTINIEVENCLQYIYFPNSFTPNNDGLNDFFKPLISGALTKYELLVYNRWGQLVFTTKNKNEGWNGILKGVQQNNTVFVWLCKYQFYGMPEKLIKGVVTIIK